MELEAVIVCHGYGDFLAHTLPENLRTLDRVVVVTHPSDWETRNLCNRLSVDCIDTTVMHDHGDTWNKGRCINMGLSHLRHKGWVMQLDADIMLPPRCRAMLTHARLREDCIYGADRFNVVGYDAFTRLKAESPHQFAWRFLVSAPPGLTMGSRLMHNELGYLPIGYFQLWHASQRRTYPVNTGSAEHSDVMFAAQWPRERRVLMPEMFVYHLESEVAAMGTNWEGRKTKRFGPPPPGGPPNAKYDAKK